MFLYYFIPNSLHLRNQCLFFDQFQIYVEVEQARLTHRYSKMKEEDGDIVAAATTMQELQVETYGSMDKREKVSKTHKKIDKT